MKPSWRMGVWVALAALCLTGLSASPAVAQAWTGVNARFSQPTADDGADSCGIVEWRYTAYKQRWINYAGPTRTGVPIMSFRIWDTDADADTLRKIIVTSVCERTNTISRIYLYRDASPANPRDTNSYYGGGDVLLQQVPIGTAFQTNDSVVITGLSDVIAANDTVWYHLVVDMNTAGIGNNPLYNETGVMVVILPDHMEIDETGGANRIGPADTMGVGPGGGGAMDGTGDNNNACVAEAPANNAYSIIIDNTGPECASFTYWNVDRACDNACDDADSVISLGDSIRILLNLDITSLPTDTCATGWPKVFVKEFTSNSGAVSMGRYKGWLNYGHFVYVADIDFSDTTNLPVLATDSLDWMNVGPTVNTPIDVIAGFYYLIAETKDVAGNVARCSILVNQPIDTKKPAVTGRPHTWALYYDANGNGVVNPGDTVRFYIDMSNEPFGEICKVTVTLYDWYGVPQTFTLTDNAGDRKFEYKHEVGVGILDVPAGDTVQMIVNDNACNVDSISVSISNAIDNVPLQMAAWTREFLPLVDYDSNACLKIGDKVRIRVTNANVDTDLVAIYANIYEAGLGDSASVFYFRKELYSQGGGTWLLDWVLGDEPHTIPPAIDLTAGNATVWLYGIDNAGNEDSLETDPLDYNIDTYYPAPIVGLSCESKAHAVIWLKWDSTETASDADKFYIYWDNGTGTISYTTPLAVEFDEGAGTWSTDGTVTLTNGMIYMFDVWTVDDCGNVEHVHPTPVACQADGVPPYMCVFEPDSGMYSCSRCDWLGADTLVEPDGFHVYIRSHTPADEDVTYINDCLGRVKDRGDGNPGAWRPLCFDVNLHNDGPDNYFDVDIACDRGRECKNWGGLNDLVGDDTCKVVELVFLATDVAGNLTDTLDIYNTCHFTFTWCNESVDVQIVKVNGNYPMYQEYCDFVGFEAYGPSNTAYVCITGGVPPYKIELQARDHHWTPGDNYRVAFVENVYAACTTLTFDASKFAKGEGDLDVDVCDASGAYGHFDGDLCVPDSIPPCAVISNPVDGKCIHRSRSILDPEEVCVTINPIENCLDPDEVVKIDYQWAIECCSGDAIVYDTVLDSTPVAPGEIPAQCDTFPPGSNGNWDSIVCVDTSTTGWKYTRRVVTDTVPCDSVTTGEWHTFAIQPGADLDTLGVGCVDWYNELDLAWITKSGTIVYLRAVLYDDQGNKFTTECVAVCVDIDTPPLCLWSPDVCTSDGKAALSGCVTMVADLNLDSANIDDIEDVVLWYKKSSDPDLYGNWHSVGSGFFGVNSTVGGTNSTVWRWDSVCTSGFTDQVYYDFRVIAKTIWGTYSYDMDGNHEFDSGTFDSSKCDMNTWYIDNAAPQIALDTAWTDINGTTVVEPNVGCTMSDPRGWLWAQYGKDITISPKIYDPDPYAKWTDLGEVRWIIYPGDDAECNCTRPGSGSPAGSSFTSPPKGKTIDSFVVAVMQGSHVLDPVTFNPKNIPFVHVTAGYQQLVLHVIAYDQCGNQTDDCLDLYLLDTDTTEAIIVYPKNDYVFCYDEADGGIDITAAGLLNEAHNKAVFSYRAAGSSTWIDFDTVGVSGAPDVTTNFETRWYPKALGLSDGDYELTVWAVDNAFNRQTHAYIKTIHLSCAEPTVTMVYPTATDPEFMGCAIELDAYATCLDAKNPITEVKFYYQSDTSGTATLIGSDSYTVNGHFNYHWTPSSSLTGGYYIYAVATNLAGKTAQSALVHVKFDNTLPWGKIIQVGSDGSDGGSGDPTLITAGETVLITATARDNVGGPPGYGSEDNCGLDSVLIFVYNSNGTVKMFGTMAQPDQVIDSLFTALWPTTGWAAGNYRVMVQTFDCACNTGSGAWWYVKITSALPEISIAVDGPTVCGYPSADEDVEVMVTVADTLYIDTVKVAVSYTGHSDVYDRYLFVSEVDMVQNNPDGSRTYYFFVDTEEFTEGLWRFRAVVKKTDGTWIEDGDADGKFDDFTFDESFDHHMLVRIDHGFTDFTVEHDATIKAHDAVTAIIHPDEACDFYYQCHGVITDYGVTGYPDTSCSYDTIYSFDPVDSGLVSLNHGIWHGWLATWAGDELNNSQEEISELWILDMNATQVRITDPLWAGYVTGERTITARKLSSATIDKVEFFYATSQTGAGTSIGTDNTVSGDVFSVTWDPTSLTDGQYWIWGVAYTGSTPDPSPIRIPVTVQTNCKVVMMPPTPSFQRTVNGEVLTFVGEHADLCVYRDSISAIQSGVGISEVHWRFRHADAPGGSYDDNNFDPYKGWVNIGSDTYGSLCTDWFTDWCDTLLAMEPEYGGCCSDGRYTLQAWVYDKAGNECHSEPMTIMIDNTVPYSEIVDIDGDETFGTCHDIILPQDTVVKFTANAIDDHSCVGLEPYPAYNSGAKYLQFYVGGCGAGGGTVDVVWVIDGSGSMADDQQAIADNAQLFVQNLGNANYRLGVLAYTDTSAPVSTTGTFKTPGVGSGEFTTDAATFGTMVTSVGDDFGDGSTENGLRALMHALEWYPWRSGAAKILVLITDENANQDLSNLGTLLPALINSGAIINTVVNPGDSAGYSTLAPGTGGMNLDFTGQWGANLAALGAQIEAIAGGNANDIGIVWGKQVVLQDGQDNAYALWNPTGLPAGQYCAWTVVIDEVGNVYRSTQRQVCIIDKTPPEAFIAGFGMSTECPDCPAHTYWIYGRSCDTDVDYVQFQYRPEGSTSQAAWTGIGISTPIGADTSGMWWKAPWNPCLLSGNFEMRVVPTDTSGNEDFDIQPILHVTLSSCGITIASASSSDAEVWFEDQRFDNFGLVNVDLKTTSKLYNNFMMAVWADLKGDLTVEKIPMWVPDPDSPEMIAGRFAGSDAVKLGGTGWFWESYITGTGTSKVSHLKRGDVNVWPLKADGEARCSKRDVSLGAKICLEPDALYEDNGVVTFPARIPTVNLSQQHFQAWPVKPSTRLVTAIRLTTELEDGLRYGTYAHVEISYDAAAVSTAGLQSKDLTVAWWDGDQWNTNYGMIADSTIKGGKAYFATTDVHGIYAVVSAGRVCNTGALTVEPAGAKVYVDLATDILPPLPTIYTTVKSNIEFGNSNRDINPNEITVVLDGQTTIYADGTNPTTGFYTTTWDKVSGLLMTKWNSTAPRLTPATPQQPHTLTVLAFNKSGFCAENTYTFAVDAEEPNVVVTGNELCANPTFNVRIVDNGGAGVDWDSVYVDVYDITGSEFSVVPKSRLMFTESPDAFDDDTIPDNFDRSTGTFSFQLVGHFAQGRRLKIVIYDGVRSTYYSAECNCEYYSYNHDFDGVPDMVGNHSEVVEELYTVWGSCQGGGAGEVVISTTGGDGNPFDPWQGQFIAFDLNGFDGGGVVTAKVYDLAGDEVASILNTAVGATVTQVSWDGRTDKGDYVAEGVYLIHFSSVGGQAAGAKSQVIKAVVKRK